MIRISSIPSNNRPVYGLGVFFCVSLLVACGGDEQKPTTTGEPVITPAAILLAGSNGDDVMLLDQVKGEIQKQFITKGSGGLSHPDSMVIGPDDALYIASGTDEATSAILRFDITTGAPLGKFASGGGMIRPYGLAFGPDGKLYVASFLTDQILRYDDKTGAFVDEFAKGNGMPDSLNGPDSLLFGPDGKLYVTTQGSVAVNGMATFPAGLKSQVLRYDIATKAVEVYVTDVMPAADGAGYVSLLGIAFGPDCTAGVCDLFVSDYAGDVRRYDYTTGMLKATLSTNYSGVTPSKNLVGGLAFGEAGQLFVAAFNADDTLKNPGAVLRFEGDSGNPLPAAGQTGAIFVKEDPRLVRPIGIVARPPY